MKEVSGPLLSLLQSSDRFYKPDLFTVTLSDGTVIRSTNADVNLVWGGNTFFSDEPALSRSKVKTVIGIEVDEMDLSILSPNKLINGFSYSNAARLGMFDGATVLVETAYVQTWPTVVGVIHNFFGFVAEVEPSRTEIRMMVKSVLDLFTYPFPRNVYQSTCLHTVYNIGCGANKASFTFSSSVSGSPSLTSISSGLSQPSGYFDQGVLTFTSGPLAGIRRTVKSYASGAFVFSNPLPAVPVVGNTFSVFAGCDRRKNTCETKFNNLARFRGFPFIPVPETTF